MMFPSQSIRCKNSDNRTTGRKAILVTGVDGTVMLRQDVDFGHSNVISVVASAISKQFVGHRLKEKRPLAEPEPGETYNEIGGSVRGE